MSSIKKNFNPLTVWMIFTNFDKEPSSSIEEAKIVRSNLETDRWTDRWRTTGDKEKLTLTFG